MSYDAVAALPLPELKQQLSYGNSILFIELHAYLGLGSAGTKEENRSLIYDHIEKQRHLRAGLQPAHGPPGAATDVDSVVTVSDPLTKSDPWKSAGSTKTVKTSKDIRKLLFDKKASNN